MTPWTLPAQILHASKRACPSTSRGRGSFDVKYDHAKMIADRLAGMKWHEIANKHGVPGPSPAKRAIRAATMVKNCWTFRNMEPQDAEKIDLNARNWN